MPLELAFDLCTLALYDIAIYADDSTSMKFAEGMLQQSQASTRAALLLACSILLLMDGHEGVRPKHGL